jgi:zinc protease
MTTRPGVPRTGRVGLAVALGVLVLGAPAVGAQAAAQASGWPVMKMPAPLPAHSVPFPPYQIKTLANGLQVLVVLHHEQPSVSFRLLVRAGAAQEPAGKPGVASFVATLLNQGTATKSSEQIADAIDEAGGVLATGSDNELAYVNGAVLKDRTDLALGLAAEIAEHPAFAAAEIDRQRRQALSSLEVSADDPSYLATAVFDRIVFGMHPYGRPNEGTPASITKLTRDDLVNFHRTWFAPNNALLAIVGDLTSDQAFAAAEKAFGSWPRKDVPVPAIVEPPTPARHLVIVDRPGSAQTEIRVGHLSIARTNPDYLPFDLAVHVLGGEGANRLFGVLRTERGLTYGAEAELHAYRMTGELVADTNTRSPQTVEVLRLIVEEIARLKNEAVDPRELHGAQDYISGSFPLTVETPSSIALLVLNQLFYGLDLKELDTFRERVDHVSVADLQRVAGLYLKPDELTIVLVGDASAFIDQLKALGFGEADRIPLADLDLGSPTLRRSNGGPQPRALAPSPR